MGFSEGDETGDEVEHIGMFGEEIPAEPIKPVIVDVGVIIAMAGMAIFVAHEDHGDSLGEEEGEPVVAHLSLA